MKTLSKLLAVSTLVGAIASPVWAADGHTAGEIIDDTVVTTKVKSLLIADPLTKAHQISVETYEGEVKLSGFVDSIAAEQRALEIARGVEGAVAVHDEMDVRN